MKTIAAAQRVQRPSLALLGVEPFRAAIEFACNKFENITTTAAHHFD